MSSFKIIFYKEDNVTYITFKIYFYIIKFSKFNLVYIIGQILFVTNEYIYGIVGNYFPGIILRQFRNRMMMHALNNNCPVTY